MSVHSVSNAILPRGARHRDRWPRCAATLALLTAACVAVGGCNITEPHWCLEMEYGDCSGGPGTPPDTVRVVGFPAERVDSTDQGLLHVGETVTLKLVLFLQNGLDTSYTATWAIPGKTASVRVTQGANGAGHLEAIAPGSVNQIVVNGRALPVWSCGGYTCTQLSRIVVSP
jgi:hypothetical protein